MSYNPPNDMDSSHDIEEAVLAELHNPPCMQGTYNTKTEKCGTIPPRKNPHGNSREKVFSLLHNESDNRRYTNTFIFFALITLIMFSVSVYRIYTNTGVPAPNQIEKK